ncbi:MAG: UDP-N-acetylmuramate--L-alanine ligase [Phycisphaerales bacterium]|nr:UDP-N-acetylmuramate--L-alanine ligase [Phycisphaerales bacterium]
MSRIVTPSDTALQSDLFRRDTRTSGHPRQQHWSSPYAARRIHLIGIGGCGMTSLGGVLLRCGAIVSGSDRVEFNAQGQLEEMGAVIRIGQAPINVSSDCELVVYSAAVGDDNPELLEARRRGVKCLKYAEMLGQVMQLRTGIAIAGTHGKSTTTAMLAYILRQAKADPTFVVGAGVRQLEGSSGVGDGPHFLVEACEYAQSFLNLSPFYSAILNIEEDHLDCYNGIEAIMEAFRSFISLVPPEGTILANGEDRNVVKAVENARASVETFGESEGMTWRALNVRHDHGCYSFDVLYNDALFLRADLKSLPGRHQVFNALVATALAKHCGISAEAVAEALSEFAGADRRLTQRGDVGGVILLDDYGHHPTEIQVTLRAVREHYPNRRLWVIFQPHQHSRTRFLLNDFARSFGLADHLLVPDIYFVRDSASERAAVCSSHLVERVRANGGDALYLPKHEQIVEHMVTHAAAGDVILTMGAGDVWKIADELVRRLA